MYKILLLRVKLFITFLFSNSKYELSSLRNKNIYVFLGADYGNLGDVAITYAQMKYLNDRYKNYNVIEIPISKTFAGIKAVKHAIGDNDIISLIGGGNTSDLYDDIEFLRQLIIVLFRKNKIIAFPQTFFFSKTLKGRFCKSISRLVYNKAEDLTIMAREGNTMKILRYEYPNIKSILLPDIVMTLDERLRCPRKGALVCMRSDRERAITDNHKKKIISWLKKQYENVDFQDTQVGGVSLVNRFEKLHNLFDIIRSREIVITDRLHAMIFCFITETPALVIDNSNNKLSGCYEWIKDCGFIKLIDNIDDLKSFHPTYNFEETHFSILDKYNNALCLRFQ